MEILGLISENQEKYTRIYIDLFVLSMASMEPV